MSSIAVSKTLPKIIHARGVVRNGLIPSAALQGNLTAGLNHAVLYRRKLLASYSGRRVRDMSSLVFPDVTGTGPTVKWRWRVHTGHGCKQMRFVVKLALARGGSNCRVRFGVTPAGGVQVFTGYVTYGVTQETPLDVPNEIGKFHRHLDVDADTTYEIELLAEDNARPVSCMIYEIAEEPDTTVDHYTVPGYAVGANILDSHRADMLPAWTALMESNANAAWNWTVDQTAIKRTINSYVNAMDGSSTSNTAATPGVTLDLTGHATYGRATVPFVFAIYASAASGTAGKAKIISSAGDIVAITNVGTAGWYTTTVNMATAETKYDLMISGDGSNEVSLFAMSLYEAE
jgi:hypothetical protein